jgi:hypothetical protein
MQFEDESPDSFIDKILKSVSRLHTRQPITQKQRKPPRFHPHPRRSVIYKPFHIDSNYFFKFRAQGVPILTSYFLSDDTNRHRLHASLTYLENNSALSVLKKL